MSTRRHRASFLAAVPLILGACASAPNPSPSSPAAIAPSASPSIEPRPTPIVTPASTAERSPTAVPPSVTGWVTHEMSFANDCCPIDDLDVTSAAGGTIHLVDHVEEALANGFDAGRYQRSTDGGRTWGAEHQLLGIGEFVAATGDRVFIAFQAYKCRSGIGVVRNDKNGAPAAWSPVTCLPGDGDVGGSEWGPQVAATGSSVYVLSIDHGTKRVHLRTSHDAGRTFASKALGTARPDSDGFVGPVLLSADDDMVAASWPDAGRPVVRVSRDGARTWGPEIPMPGGVGELSVRDGRTLAQGWFGADGPWYRLASRTEFESVAAPAPTTNPDPSRLTATRLVLGPAGALGGLGTESCSTTWRTSADGGATWSVPELIADGCLSIAIGDSSPFPVSWLDDGHIVTFLDGLVAERP